MTRKKPSSALSRSNAPDQRRQKADLKLGEAEIGIGVASDAAIVPGLDAFPLPIGAQSYSVYVAGVSSGSKEVDAAKALIVFLTSPAFKQALKANGFEAP